MDNILEIKNLSVELGGKNIVRNIDLKLSRGEVLAILGESGSGKSTLARTIMGFHPLSEGKIFFKNNRIDDLNEKEYSKIRGKEIALIFQNSMSTFNPTIKTGYQVEEPMQIHLKEEKKNIFKKVLSSFEKLNLDKNRTYNSFPHELSGGMKQRASFVMGTICDPDLLILDEVTTSLDSVNARAIISSVEELKNKKGILLITHDIGLARKLADRIAVIKNGIIVEKGRNILSDPWHPYTKLLLSSEVTLLSDRKKVVVPKYIKSKTTSMGCPFAPNCFESMRICYEELGYKKSSGDRMIRCWQHHPDVLKEGS